MIKVMEQIITENQDPTGNLSAFRQEGLEQFRDLDRPASTMEDWRLTNVSHLFSSKFTAPTQPDNPWFLKTVEAGGFENSPRLVFVNGIFAPQYSDLDKLSAGIEALSLGEAMERQPKLIRKTLSKIIPTRSNSFVAANTSGLDTGLFLRISENTKITNPLHILCVTTGNDNTYAAPRTLVILEKNSTADIIEHYISDGEVPGFTNTVTEISVAEKATLNFFRIQEESPTSDHIASLGISQKAGSNVTTGIFDLGGKLARSDISVNLEGEACDTKLVGLQILSGHQHIDNHTVIRHAAPHCTSEELFKAILGDTSHSVFSGLIKVGEGAAGTDSVQTNRNLLLSADARVDSNPQLEIYTDDVKCSHGSATGQLDEEALFYFRTRGISIADAYLLMVTGFANQVLDKISIPAIENYLRTALNRKLNLISKPGT